MKWIIAAIMAFLSAAFGYIYWSYYFDLADGVKTGQVNYVTHKGIIFKTWEGKIIQAGLKSQQQSIQSNEFIFSVENEELAKKIQLLSDQVVTVHYREYNNALPWRGYSKFVVDSIVNITSSSNHGQYALPSVHQEPTVPSNTNNTDDSHPDEWYE